MENYMNVSENEKEKFQNCVKEKDYDKFAEMLKEFHKSDRLNDMAELMTGIPAKKTEE